MSNVQRKYALGDKNLQITYKFVNNDRMAVKFMEGWYFGCSIQIFKHIEICDLFFLSSVQVISLLEPPEGCPLQEPSA